MSRIGSLAPALQETPIQQVLLTQPIITMRNITVRTREPLFFDYPFELSEAQ